MNRCPTCHQKVRYRPMVRLEQIAKYANELIEREGIMRACAMSGVSYEAMRRVREGTRERVMEKTARRIILALRESRKRDMLGPKQETYTNYARRAA